MERRCAACDEWRCRYNFSRNQWTKGEGHSRCKECVGNPPPPAAEAAAKSDEEIAAEAEAKRKADEEKLKAAAAKIQLQAIDNLMASRTFTYDGWEDDVLDAEDCVMNRTLFDHYVKNMRRKQASHVGDRSHPQLQMLDSLRVELTYNGWQADVRRAENSFHHFDDHIEKIRKKQNIHTTQQNALRLAERVPLQPRGRHINDSQNQTAGIQDDKECAVCWSSKKTHAFVPCGHKCVCAGCAETILSGNKKCPLCQAVCERIIKIFQ